MTIIEVQLEVKQGSYKNLEELSHGQKCRVVLMVALAEGDSPLLVDQPEDALHAPGIEEGIVSSLRNDRGARQCIFATRNANILVSADTEQIIALEADAENGWVKSTGSLDSYDHKRLVIYHVEGGSDAFRRRNTMYTLRHSVLRRLKGQERFSVQQADGTSHFDRKPLLSWRRKRYSHYQIAR